MNKVTMTKITKDRIVKGIVYRLRNFYYHVRYPKLHRIYYRFSLFTLMPRITYVINLDLINAFSHVPGAIVECGTWRGGMIGGIASVLGDSRVYYLYDSFEGLPEAKPIDGGDAIRWQNDKESELYFDNCRAEINEAQKAMALSGAKNIYIYKGFFNESLSSFPDNTPIAILRLDGDWYESTMTCLENLYPKVVIGGVIIIDDYYTWDGCSRAIHDYLWRERLNDKIFQWNNCVAYIVKRGGKYAD